MAKQEGFEYTPPSPRVSEKAEKRKAPSDADLPQEDPETALLRIKLESDLNERHEQEKKKAAEIKAQVCFTCGSQAKLVCTAPLCGKYTCARHFVHHRHARDGPAAASPVKKKQRTKYNLCHKKRCENAATSECERCKKSYCDDHQITKKKGSEWKHDCESAKYVNTLIEHGIVVIKNVLGNADIYRHLERLVDELSQDPDVPFFFSKGQLTSEPALPIENTEHYYRNKQKKQWDSLDESHRMSLVGTGEIGAPYGWYTKSMRDLMEMILEGFVMKNFMAELSRQVDRGHVRYAHHPLRIRSPGAGYNKETETKRCTSFIPGNNVHQFLCSYYLNSSETITYAKGSYFCRHDFDVEQALFLDEAEPIGYQIFSHFSSTKVKETVDVSAGDLVVAYSHLPKLPPRENDRSKGPVVAQQFAFCLGDTLDVSADVSKRVIEEQKQGWNHMEPLLDALGDEVPLRALRTELEADTTRDYDVYADKYVTTNEGKYESLSDVETLSVDFPVSQKMKVTPIAGRSAWILKRTPSTKGDRYPGASEAELRRLSFQRVPEAIELGDEEEDIYVGEEKSDESDIELMPMEESSQGDDKGKGREVIYISD